MSVRLPSGPDYASQVKKEQRWLPFLKDYVSFKIPEVVYIGQESKDYPYGWSVCRWIDGELPTKNNIENMNKFAKDLAIFIKEMHSVDASEGPIAGKHNFYRGGNLSVYGDEYVSLVEKTREILAVEESLLMEIWNLAISSHWEQEPVWVHGDLVPANMLIMDGELEAVIDFGILGVGDPACDLSMYWTFFEDEFRDVFKSELDLDECTWDRARGWVIWKQLFDMDYYEEDVNKVNSCKKIVYSLLDEYAKI